MIDDGWRSPTRGAASTSHLGQLDGLPLNTKGQYEPSKCDGKAADQGVAHVEARGILGIRVCWIMKDAMLRKTPERTRMTGSGRAPRRSAIVTPRHAVRGMVAG